MPEEPVDYNTDLVKAVRELDTITASADAVGGAASVAATRALLPAGRRVVTNTRTLRAFHGFAIPRMSFSRLPCSPREVY